MIDPANNQLRPPIRRSWLRLRLGKAYYAGKRYLLWCSPKFRWAKERRTEKLPCLQFPMQRLCCVSCGGRIWHFSKIKSQI